VLSVALGNKSGIIGVLIYCSDCGSILGWGAINFTAYTSQIKG
jgi:hypothetical protein